MSTAAIEMNRTLADLNPGDTAVLDRFDVSAVHQRLLAMGISPGSPVKMVRRMSGRGNVYVQIGERSIAFRRAEAELIRVCRLTHDDCEP